MNKRTQTLVYVLLGSIALAFIVFGVMGASLSSKSSDMGSSTNASSTEAMTGTKPSAMVPSRGTAKNTPAPVAPSAAPEVVWRFMQHTNSGGVNQTSTDVTLQADGKQYEIGTFLGVCKQIAAEDIQGAGEVSAVQCLVQNKGTEIGVFKVGTGYVVQKGDITIGDARTPSTRSAFVTVVKLP